MSAFEEKRQIRRTIRTLLKGFGPGQFRAFAESAVKNLESQQSWRDAEVILGYSGIEGELDLWPALLSAMKSGKKVALPRYDSQSGVYGAALISGGPEDLVPAGFGVLEPSVDAPVLALNRLDFVLVPGVAFDPAGGRLGRGRGYYDRLLAEVPGIKCGVALDEQIVARLPAEAHDIAMNVILTPTRWLAIPPCGNY